MSFYDLIKWEDGVLKPLLEKVKNDPDLDLQIRKDNINIYYKGNNLLNLDQNYLIKIDSKFKSGIAEFKSVNNKPLTKLSNDNCHHFIKEILPKIKENIVNNLMIVKSYETEFEQLLIRVNNYNTKVNSEYFITDRQYSKFDIIGVFSDRGKRRNNPLILAPFLGEIKYSLNQDIKYIHEQICRYYEKILKNYEDFIKDIEDSLHLKATLGLLKANDKLIDKFKTATIDKDPKKLRIVIILIDYNPNSKLDSDLHRLKELAFSDQIYIFNTGLSMWEKNVLKII